VSYVLDNMKAPKQFCWQSAASSSWKAATTEGSQQSTALPKKKTRNEYETHLLICQWSECISQDAFAHSPISRNQTGSSSSATSTSHIPIPISIIILIRRVLESVASLGHLVKQSASVGRRRGHLSFRIFQMFPLLSTAWLKIFFNIPIKNKYLKN